MASNSQDWDSIEANYWAQMRTVRDHEDRELQQAFDDETKSVRLEQLELAARRTRLAHELKAVRDNYDEREAYLRQFEQRLEKKQAAIMTERQHQDVRQREKFLQLRQESASLRHQRPADSDDSEEKTDRPISNGTGKATNGVTDHTMPDAQAEAKAKPLDLHDNKTPAPLAGPDMPTSSHSDSLRPPTVSGLEIYDATGTFVGTLRQVKQANHWTQTVSTLPIKRQVVIRAGRQINQDRLDSYSEPLDHKNSKWLSLMIQATGDEQEQPCVTCTKQSGLYPQCVIIGGKELPRCGNCEWNRHACHGAARHAHTEPQAHTPLLTRPNYSGSETLVISDSPVLRSTERPSVGFTAVNNQASTSVTSLSTLHSNNIPIQPAKQRRSLPDGKASKHASKQSTPAMSDSAPPALASEQSAEQSDTPAQPTEQEQPEEPEITKETLTLVHDGMVYLEPEIMRGVPVKKITPDHAYWEPSWRSIENHIQPKLDEWNKKYEQYVKDSKEGSSEKHAKYLAGRQVNRGKAVLAFLKEGEIHPFQFVGKQWINNAMSNYDTVYRLVATLEELPKFNIDVKPLDWLRQRMSELYEANPEGFKLDRIVHTLYGDSKLIALRGKNGYGNIGRPSGYKTKEGTATRGPRTDKRKEHPTGSARNTPKKARGARLSTAPAAEPTESTYSTPGFTGDMVGDTTTPPSYMESPRGGSTRKRPPVVGPPAHEPTLPPVSRPSSSTAVDLDEDLAFSGYTSTDSFSKDRVMKVDWRVYQIKTAKQTSNTDITQYWHWVDITREGRQDENMEHIFEHQVLRDVDPASWGVYKEPIDFHLRLRELTEIAFANGCPKIIIRTKPVAGVEHRGDVLAHFKRDRTKRRFLTFMRKKGVKLVKDTPVAIEHTWDTLDSEVLPDDDSE